MMDPGYSTYLDTSLSEASRVSGAPQGCSSLTCNLLSKTGSDLGLFQARLPAATNAPKSAAVQECDPSL